MNPAARKPRPYWLDDFFMMRAPLLPYRTFVALGLELETAARLREGASPDDVGGSFAADCRRVRARLREIATDEAFREALFVSSESLHAALDRWERDPLSKRGAAAERAILKYVTRASTRCTPYGLMAGVGMGSVGGPPTALELGGRHERRRHARVDAKLLMSIAQHLAADPALRTALTYVPNSTLYEAGPRLRYFEAPGHPFSGRSHLVTVACSDVLKRVLEVATGGARWADLVAAIRSCDEDIAEAEATEFLEEIVQSQILIADVFPSPVGPEMLPKFLEKVRPLALPDDVKRVLDALVEGSRVLGEERVGGAIGTMQTAAALVGGFVREAASDQREDAEAGEGDDEHEETDERDESGERSGAEPAGMGVFQVDSILPLARAHVSSRSLAPLLPVLDALYAVNSQKDTRALADFITEFTRRYDDAEVPLCEALDPESGVRFGTGLAQGEPSPLLRVPAGDETAPRSDEFTDVDRWKLELLLAARARNETEIRLTSQQILDRFPPGRRPPALSFSVMLSILGSSSELDDGTARLLLVMSGGSHTMHLFGRFAHVLGDELTDRLRRTARREQAGSAPVLAEVAYLPPFKLGNICQGPSFRPHTIPYRCPRPDASGEIIAIDDLLVSVRGNRVLLRSQRLGAPVQPRVDHAMNISHPTNPAVFNFLGMLQHQDVNTFNGWTWGPLARTPDLPRVTIDGVIVSPRVWTVAKQEVEALCGTRSKESFEADGLAAFARVQEWRARWGLPRRVAVGTTTDYLAADLDNPLSVDLMLRELRRYGRVEEVFHEEMAAAVGGGEGAYTHEIIVPVWTVDPSALVHDAAAPARQRTPAAAGEHRRLRIRDGVLYAKIYGGESALDKLLREGLRDLIVALGPRAGLRNWFFIRYYDPLPHLRVRLFGAPNHLLGVAVPALEELCERASGVARLQFDAYDPETDRYGGAEGIELAETFFGIDSRHAVELLRSYMAAVPEDEPGDAGASRRVHGVEQRWLLVALSVCRLLDDFGLSSGLQAEFIAEYLRNMAGDLRPGPIRQKAIGALHRRHRDVLDAVAAGLDDDAYFTADVRRILTARSHESAPVLAELRRRAEQGRLATPLGSIHSSLMHMHCNRLFISQQRRQETVLLEVVARMLKGAIGRRRRAQPERKAAEA